MTSNPPREPAGQGPPPLPPGEPGAQLLQPLALGTRLLPNRIVFGAHLTNFGGGGLFSARHLAYYGARAAGGAGLIVTEPLTVHPLDRPYEHVPRGDRQEIVASLADVAERVRASATVPPLLVAALNHSGAQSSGRILRQSPWAPSPFADVASRKMAREMEPEQIAEVVAGFAAAAGRVARAGLDGVEINAAQHSLLRQFLSPLTNFRSDEYGGSLQNRARLLCAVLAAAREAVGPAGVVGLKLCGDELAPWGGLSAADCVEVARLVSEQAPPDYLSIQVGGPYSVHMTDPGMPVPEGYGAEPAALVRAALRGSPPVFVEGRIERPATAARLLAEGKADAAVMTRALVSDPDLPAKLRGGAAEPIRPHVGMTRYFSVRGDWNRPLGDLANPRAGREERLPPLARAPRPAPALVIGGGPAGMEAAITLARQGHPVRLVEGSGRLGGMASALAEALPSRAEFQPLVDYQRAMLDRLGVAVELGRTIGGFEPWMEEFGSVFLAGGAVSRPPPLAGAAASGPPAGARGGGPLWLAARELIVQGTDALGHAPARSGARAVVVDHEFGFRMAAAVEKLLDAGFAVDVVTEDFFVGRELVESAEMLWFNRVAERGARFFPRLRAVKLNGVNLKGGKLDGAELVCADRFSGKERRFGPLAVVVHAQREVPDTALWHALRERHPRVIPVGDARAPRLMGEAILHAHRAALAGN